MATPEEDRPIPHEEEEEKEEEEVEWEVEGEEDEEARTALGVMGKIWTERNINANALIATMRKIWNPKYGMDANCLEKNIYFFQFHHWRDKEFVMEAQPWHFDKHVLALSDVQGDRKPSEYPMHLIPFWVRVYDLPILGRLNETNARRLGDKIGSFVKVDKTDIIGINKSLRIRTLIDVRKPLKKEIELKLRGGAMERVRVKYEKLPVFCYFCGTLGHGEKDCELTSSPGNRVCKYSEKMRASPWQANKGDVTGEEREGQSCARKLFVLKKTAPSMEGMKETMENVELVMEKMGEVTMSLKDKVDQSKEGQEEKDESTAALINDQPPCPVTFNIGSSVSTGKKFRRVQRKNTQEGETRDTGQHKGDSNGVGKRKDYMEIDTMDGPKKCKVGENVSHGSTNSLVVAVAEQPREQQ